MKIQSPKIIIREEGSADSFTDNRVFDLHFVNEEIELDAFNLEINGCLFEGCTIKGKTTNSFFYHSRFEKCDLSNMRFINCGMHCVEFVDSRLVGSSFAKCSIDEIFFSSILGTYMEFVETKMKRTLFKNSSLQNAFMDRVVYVKDVFFEECQMEEISYQYTPLKGIDLSSCVITGINGTQYDVRGLIINEFQAADLIKMLGVKIR